MRERPDKVRKEAGQKYGKENVHVERGHWQLFKPSSKRGLEPIGFPNGCRLYVRAAVLDALPKPPRMVRPMNKFHEEPAGKPDWSTKCSACDAVPIVPQTGLCGPCSFGDESTAGGNW